MKKSLYDHLRDGIQQFVYRVLDPGIRFMIRLGVTPNMITTMGLLGNIAAAAILIYSALYVPATCYWWVGLAGWVIIGFSILDMVDGRMARVGNLSSTFGAFYDSVLDRYSELFTLSGIAFYFIETGHPVATVITFLSLIGSIMVSYVRARAEGLDVECKPLCRRLSRQFRPDVVPARSADHHRCARQLHRLRPHQSRAQAVEK